MLANEMWTGFLTYVDATGYELMDHADTGERLVAARANADQRRSGRLYDLREQPAAFMRFADALEPAAIVEFANQFGLLRDDQTLPVSCASGEVELRRGVLLRQWQGESATLKQLVSNWFSNRDAFFHPMVEIALDVFGEPVAERRVLSDVLHDINVKLQPVFAEVRRSRKNHVEWSLSSHHMLGALWLQFADAVVNSSRFRRCAECRAWFQVPTAPVRFDRLYCDGRCRNRAYRRRSAGSADSAPSPSRPN